MLSLTEDSESAISKQSIINITDCSLLTEKDYCLKLLELENVKRIIITENYVNKDLFINYDEGFKQFVNKIDGKGNHKYRLLVEFNDSKYATIRFGEE